MDAKIMGEHLVFGVGFEVVKLIVQKLWPSDKEQIDKLNQELINECALEANLSMRRLTEALVAQGKTIDELRRDMEQRLKPSEVRPLVLMLQREAVYAATSARRRLLCAALAGTFNPYVEIEEKSRVARAVAALEPSDMILLRQVRRMSFPMQAHPLGGEVPAQQPLQMSALYLAGCISMTAPEYAEMRDSPATAHTTSLGEAVLEFLAHWTPEGDGPLGTGEADGPAKP
jgi:hypothetical protein